MSAAVESLLQGAQQAADTARPIADLARELGERLDEEIATGGSKNVVICQAAAQLIRRAFPDASDGFLFRSTLEFLAKNGELDELGK